MTNKAKFRNAKNAYNSSNSNDYEQKTMNNELLKTNPNKANLACHSSSEDGLVCPASRFQAKNLIKNCKNYLT
jgi:hypothetical protein